MATRKHCAFCGASDAKISNEHAWPNWIRTLFPPTPTTIVGTRPPKKPITFIPRPDNMGVTVNAVCKPCNEGWMEQLEADVRPLLTPMIRDGTQTTLTRAQQAALARWVMKTTMVFEFTNNARPFYSFEERDDVRNGGLPGALMWMARYEGATFVSTAVAKGLSYDVTVDGNMTRQPGNALTLSAGQFVVQVLSVRPPQGLPGLFVPMPKQFADHVVSFWPPSDEAPVWPPPAALGDAALDGFMSRFAPDRE